MWLTSYKEYAGIIFGTRGYDRKKIIQLAIPEPLEIFVEDDRFMASYPLRIDKTHGKDYYFYIDSPFYVLTLQTKKPPEGG